MKKCTVILLSVFFGLLIPLWGTESQEMLNAVKEGDVVTVKKILDTNANFDVNGRYTRWEMTLLMYAVDYAHIEVVELLLERGADPTLKTINGLKASDYVSNSEYFGGSKESYLQHMRQQKKSEEEIAKRLQEYNQKYSPEMLKKRQQIKDLVLKAYTDKMKQGDVSPIWKAIVSDDLSKVKALLVRGDISNINMQNTKGETPLIVAVRNGRYDIVKLLLRRGAKIGITDKKSKSAYSYAQMMLELLNHEKQEQYISGLKDLVSQKIIDLSKKDKNGDTLLMKAVATGNLEQTKILLEAGVNPAVKNNKGQTAKDLVCSRMEQYLEKKKLILDLLKKYSKDK